MNLDLFLLFVEVVENGLAFEGQDFLLVLFVETAVKRVALLAALAYRFETFGFPKFIRVSV